MATKYRIVKQHGVYHIEERYWFFLWFAWTRHKASLSEHLHTDGSSKFNFKTVPEAEKQIKYWKSDEYKNIDKVTIVKVI